MLNNYFNINHPLRPYTHSLPATPGTVPPPNALRDSAPPTAPEGFWPGESGGVWVNIEDHRGEEGYVNGEPFTITDFGPYPQGWSTEPPAPPEPTDEEKYNAEREAVRRKYESPFDGVQEGILFSLNMRYTSALMAGKGQNELGAIALEKEQASAAMAQEYDAIDHKYLGGE